MEASGVFKPVEIKTASPYKWRAILGLILVALALFFEADLVWGVLFLLWVIPDLRSGITYFFEPIERDANPFVYWLIMMTWIVLSLWMLLGPFT